MSLARDLYGEGYHMCCICFEIREDDDPAWAKDKEGVTWDTCTGDCARQAGIEEME